MAHGPSPVRSATVAWRERGCQVAGVISGDSGGKPKDCGVDCGIRAAQMAHAFYE
jgi:hypothetical protein